MHRSHESSKLYSMASNNRAEILLFIAARRGDVADMEHVWEQNMETLNVNCIVSNSCPLLAATKSGVFDAVKFLLDKGAKPDFDPLASASGASMPRRMISYLSDANVSELTPLCWSCFHGDREAAELLILHGAKVDRADAMGMLPIHFAAWSGAADIVEMLLLRSKRTPAPNTATLSTTPPSSTPLLSSSPTNQQKSVKLISSLATRKSRHYRLTPGLRGVTPLHLAASHGSSSILLEMMYSRETFAGLDIDSIKASQPKEYYRCIELLIDAGANPNDVDCRLGTALMRAAGKGFDEGIKLLLERGARVDMKDITEMDAYGYAVSNSCESAARLLLNAMPPEPQPHLPKACKCEKQQCNGCHQMVLGCALEEHTNFVCLRTPRRCPNSVGGCEESFGSVAALRKHLPLCDYYRVMCHACRLPFIRRKFEDHYIKKHVISQNAYARPQPPQLPSHSYRRRSSSFYGTSSSSARSGSTRNINAEASIVICNGCWCEYPREEMRTHACFRFEWHIMNLSEVSPQERFASPHVTNFRWD